MRNIPTPFNYYFICKSPLPPSPAYGCDLKLLQESSVELTYAKSLSLGLVFKVWWLETFLSNKFMTNWLLRRTTLKKFEFSYLLYKMNEIIMFLLTFWWTEEFRQLASEFVFKVHKKRDPQTTFNILKFSSTARPRGHKQRKLNDHVYSILLFAYSRPHYQADFQYIPRSLFKSSCLEAMCRRIISYIQPWVTHWVMHTTVQQMVTQSILMIIDQIISILSVFSPDN